MSSLVVDLMLDLVATYFLPMAIREAGERVLGTPARGRNASAATDQGAARLRLVPPLGHLTVTEMISSIPGRMRMRVDALRGDPGCAEQVTSSVWQLSGVGRVTASSLTTTVVVEYDAEALTEDEVIGAVESVRLRAGERAAAAPPAVRPQMKLARTF